MYEYINMYKYKYVHMIIWKNDQIYMYLQLRINKWIYMNMYICIYVCTYVYMYEHIN